MSTPSGRSRPRSSSSPSPPQGDSGSKRQRVAIACGSCRSRKSRCDGARPKCSSCSALHFTCVYTKPASSSQDIQEQLAAIEAKVAALAESVHAGKSTARSESQNPLDEASFVSVRDDSGQGPDPEELDESNDGMEAIVFTEEEDAGFFGPSSNIAFTRHISRALARMSSQEEHNPAAPAAMSLPLVDDSIMRVSRAPSPSPRAMPDDRAPVNIYQLPPERTVRALVGRYFANTGLLFPYVHEASLLDTYEQLRRRSFARVRRTWLGLLNMIMALALSSSPYGTSSAASRAQESAVYYQRARRLCDVAPHHHAAAPAPPRGASLETVQHHLLMSQYLQGTQRSIQAWPVHGLAVKAAFQLGLHSSDAARKCSPLEREVRKRTWYGCVVLDRTLSMTFGRPAAIPDDYVRLALPEDYGAADQLRQSSVLFFNATINLYKVMWEAIHLLYDGNTGCGGRAVSGFELGGRIFQMERQMFEWRRALPPHLQLQSAGELLAMSNADQLDVVAERFRLLLALRYYSLRILIHRPILDRLLALPRGPEATLEAPEGVTAHEELLFLEQNGLGNVQRCVQASIEIISMVNLVVHWPPERRRVLGSWWFTLYYTFSAALVIFASALVPQDANTAFVPLEASRSHLDKAIDTLRYLDQGNRMADRCAKYLERLGHVLDSLASVQLYGPTGPSMGFLPGSQAHSPAGMAGISRQFPLLTQFPPDLDLGDLLADTGFEFLS